MVELQFLNAARILALEVQNAFVDVLLAKSALALARENLEFANTTVNVNAVRLKAGEIAEHRGQVREPGIRRAHVVPRPRLQVPAREPQVLALVGRGGQDQPGEGAQGYLHKERALGVIRYLAHGYTLLAEQAVDHGVAGFGAAGTHASPRHDLELVHVAVAFLNEPADFATVDRLLPRLAAQAAEPLLDALAASEVRATRRAILERLVRLGPVLGQSVTARLSDERWYVKRNLLTLLDLLPELPPGFSALQWLGDSDPRVRVEALKLGLKSPAERDRVITRGLEDTEHRIVRLALSAAFQGVPADAVPHVIAVVNNRTLPPDMRIPAIRLLGASRSPQALETLLSLADGGRTLLGRRRLPGKSRELLTALTALASGWGAEPRAVEVLLVAALSSDPQIRAATDPEGVAV